jgi:hypothetical protein
MIAEAVGELEAEGVRPADCWDLLGWDLEFVRSALAPAPAAVPAPRTGEGT